MFKIIGVCAIALAFYVLAVGVVRDFKQSSKKAVTPSGLRSQEFGLLISMILTYIICMGLDRYV